MPERPDLEYVALVLGRELPGRLVNGFRLRKPVVLRLAVDGPPAAAQVGRTFGAVSRRAHFLLLELGVDRDLVVAPMLAGRFALAAAADREPADVACVWELDDGRELRYRDDVQMGKVYVVPRGDHQRVPGFGRVGLDVLDEGVFTRQAFRALARGRRDQLKVMLLDKGALDAFGNAYADEALFAARLHPKSRTRDLSDEDLDRLHAAAVAVLAEARATIFARRPPLDEKQRDFLKVRNRHGEPCPRCGAKIRRAGVLGHDAFFCPSCQPETRRGAIVDWRKAKR